MQVLIKYILWFIKKSQNNRSGICEIANDNAKGQVIISGDSDSIKKFQFYLKRQ